MYIIFTNFLIDFLLNHIYDDQYCNTTELFKFMSSTWSILKNIFSRYLYFEIFFLGLISGLPFSIMYTTMVAWSTRSGVALTVASAFAFARTPYAFKYLWAPFLDHVKLPILHNIFGRRRSWMLITLIINIIVLLSINNLSIVNDTNIVLILCIILGFFAATYDISYDALRIEKLDSDDQALGAAIASLGYKTGSYITGAGVLIFVSTSQLYQVSFDPWKMSIYIISGIFALGFIFTLTISSSTISSSSKNFAEAVIEPVKDILKRENIIWIVLLIVTFKGGQAMLNFMCFPFYAKLGYTDGQIALVVKSFGIIMSMLGIFIGGLFIKKFGLYKGILYCGLLQALSDFSFIWLNYQNGELWALFVNIMLENISGGMGSCGLVSLISVLCNKQFAGAHFAIFSSLAVLINSTMSGFAGKIVDNVGWNWFFFTDFMISLPPLFIVFYLYKKYEAQPTKI